MQTSNCKLDILYNCTYIFRDETACIGLICAFILRPLDPPLAYLRIKQVKLPSSMYLVAQKHFYNRRPGGSLGRLTLALDWSVYIFRIPHFTHHSAFVSTVFDSAFYFPHSAFRNSAFYQHPTFCQTNIPVYYDVHNTNVLGFCLLLQCV